MSQIVAERHLRLNDGKLLNAMILVNKAQRRLELWVGRHCQSPTVSSWAGMPMAPRWPWGTRRPPRKYFICGHRSSAYYLGLWKPRLSECRRQPAG